jgi:Subtilase family
VFILQLVNSRRRTFIVGAVLVVAGSVPVAVRIVGAKTVDPAEALSAGGFDRVGPLTDIELEELKAVVGPGVLIDTACSSADKPVMYRRQLIALGPNAGERAARLLETPNGDPGVGAFRRPQVGPGGNGNGDPSASAGKKSAVIDDVKGAALIEIGTDADINAVKNRLELAGDLTVDLNHVLSPQPGMKWKPDAAPKSTSRKPTVFPSGGAGQVIAVLDTGLPHNYAATAGTLEADVPRVLAVGPDEIWDRNGDNIVDHPFDGHGAFISNLAKDVAPDATVVSVNITNSDTPEAAASGLTDEWTFYKGVVAALAGDAAHGIPAATILNASVGTYSCEGDIPAGLKAAVDAIKNAGAVLTAAAGNERVANAQFYPAAFSCDSANVLAVGALDFDQFELDSEGQPKENDKPIAAFSNSGQCAPVFASGTHLVSSWIKGAKWRDAEWNNGQPIGDFAEWQGTSMAAPLVAATLARVASDVTASDPTVATARSAARDAVATVRAIAATPTHVVNQNGSRSTYDGAGAIVVIRPPAKPIVVDEPTTTTTTDPCRPGYPCE